MSSRGLDCNFHVDATFFCHSETGNLSAILGCNAIEPFVYQESDRVVAIAGLNDLGKLASASSTANL